MFHGDIVAAMEALPIVTRYPLEMSNLKYSSSRLPHGNYRCPKFHGAAPFSIVERLLSRLDRQGGRERDREREKERDARVEKKKFRHSLLPFPRAPSTRSTPSLSFSLLYLLSLSLSRSKHSIAIVRGLRDTAVPPLYRH